MIKPLVIIMSLIIMMTFGYGVILLFASIVTWSIYPVDPSEWEVSVRIMLAAWVVVTISAAVAQETKA